jgi:hypothetical protein
VNLAKRTSRPPADLLDAGQGCHFLGSAGEPRSCFVVPMRLDHGFASAEDGSGSERDRGERAARQRKGESTSAEGDRV